MNRAVRPVPLAAALAAAARRLAAAGVPSPRHDAEALAAHLLGVPRGRLATAATIDATGYAALIERRAGREPLQHLTGRAGFRRLELAVGRGGFVPRPETEVVVEAVLAELARLARPAVVADLCAGVGPIALAVAQEAPAAVVHAVELDPVAYGWLTRNAAERAAAGDRAVVVHRADVAAALAEQAGAVDVVVANPPYIPDDARPLDPEVERYDPPVALYGGPDGLAVIRVVIGAAARLLRPGGLLVVEHADGQGQAVPSLLPPPWREVADHPDLLGRPRFTVARWGGGGGPPPAHSTGRPPVTATRAPET